MGLYTSFVSSVVFPLQERLKGHDTVAIRRKMEDTQWLSGEAVARIQLQRLKELLEDVARHVPYYRDLFSQL